MIRRSKCSNRSNVWLEPIVLSDWNVWDYWDDWNQSR
jgi:hypothetical protein